MAVKFWTYLETDKYNIGLTSRTVYIYDKQGNELTKFKDLNYAYKGCVSHNQSLLAVKSTEGRMAIYSLDRLELITKFRFSKVDGAQDDNCIFSKDDRYLFNVERHVSSLKTALSIYNTSDFLLEKQLFAENGDWGLSVIEYDEKLDDYFVLGLSRGQETKAAKSFFVARLVDDELQDMRVIDEATYLFLRFAKSVEFAGFTEESYKWWFLFKTITLDELKSMNLSLSHFWKKSN